MAGHPSPAGQGALTAATKGAALAIAPTSAGHGIIDAKRHTGPGGGLANDEDQPHDDGGTPPPRLPGPLPPELAALPAEELRAIFEESLLIANRWLHSPTRAREVVSDLYQKLTTTRRWDPTKAPLRVYVIHTMRSLMRHERGDRFTKKEREANVVFSEQYYAEPGASPEQMHLDHAEESRREARAKRHLEQLEQRIEGLPLARSIVQAHRERDFEKPAELASYLDAPVKDVYRALDMLRHHIGNIRKEDSDREGET
jgi:DNA-directed RNA polymerase specialized sigma24 family protein